MNKMLLIILFDESMLWIHFKCISCAPLNFGLNYFMGLSSLCALTARDVGPTSTL